MPIMGFVFAKILGILLKFAAIFDEDIEQSSLDYDKDSLL